MSSHQSGGANDCRANGRYACNFLNIKSKKCPGYLLSERKRTDDGDYAYKWHPGGDKLTPKGHSFVSDRPLARPGTDSGNQPNGNDTQCLPRDNKGKLIKKGSPNQYCEEYTTTGREQRGCVKNKKASKKIIQKSLPERGAMKIKDKKQRSLPPIFETKQSVTRPPPDSFEILKPYTKNKIEIMSHPTQKYKFFVNASDGFKLKPTSNRGIGLFATKTIEKGHKIPYLGKPTKEEQVKSGNDDYIYEVKNLHKCQNKDETFINGDPKIANVLLPKPWAVSFASFANEPNKNEKANAEFVDIQAKCGNKTVKMPYLKINKRISAGTEILVSYNRRTDVNMKDEKIKVKAEPQKSKEDSKGKGEISENSENKKKINSRPLHNDGYEVFKSLFLTGEDLIDEIKQINTFKPIANQGRAVGDKKRQHADITDKMLGSGKYPKLETFLDRDVKPWIKKSFPGLKMNELGILKSEKDNKKQDLHRDYNLERLEVSDDQVPLSVIVALQDNTKLRVRKGGIRGNKGAQPTTITLRSGDVIAFRGDLIHGGENYDDENYRIHFFLDSQIKRSKNKIYYASD